MGAGREEAPQGMEDEAGRCADTREEDKEKTVKRLLEVSVDMGAGTGWFDVP